MAKRTHVESGELHTGDKHSWGKAIALATWLRRRLPNLASGPATALRKRAESAKHAASWPFCLQVFWKTIRSYRPGKLHKLCQRKNRVTPSLQQCAWQSCKEQSHRHTWKLWNIRATDVAVRRCKKNAEKAMRLVAPVLRKLGARRITGFPNAACQTCQCFASTKQIIFGNKQHTFPLKNCIQKATDATVDNIQVWYCIQADEAMEVRSEPTHWDFLQPCQFEKQLATKQEIASENNSSKNKIKDLQWPGERKNKTFYYLWAGTLRQKYSGHELEPMHKRMVFGI